jgi:LysM repeat protein
MAPTIMMSLVFSLSWVYAASASKPTCVPNYKTVAGDSIFSIPPEHSISTLALIDDNQLDVWKNQTFPVNTPLCLPNRCQIYQVQEDDSCDGVAATFHLTLNQFISLNPGLKDNCQYLPELGGYYICSG